MRPPPIVVIPLTPWELERWLPARVREELHQLLELDVQLEEPLALEELVGSPVGTRISSNMVVDALAAREGERVGMSRRWLLGLTDRELFAAGRGDVFGEAALGGCWAVVSAARLQDRTIPDTTLQRLVKECAHELGHLAGLGHCHRESCAMKASATPAGVDDKAANFCPNCEERFRDGSRS